MRTQEEMQAACKDLLEIHRVEAKAHCEATAKFGGPLLKARELRCYGPNTYWKCSPSGREAAAYYGRMAAFDFLSLAPRAHLNRQDAMAHYAGRIILDQIRAIIGEKAYKKLNYTSELPAVLKFWEIIVRFAEPCVTSDWIERYRMQLSQNDENERRTKHEAAKARKAKRGSVRKAGKKARS